MKNFILFSVFITISMFLCCAQPDRIGEFFIESISPRSTQFENTLKLEVHFSQPININKLKPEYITLINNNCPECQKISISAFHLNEGADILTIESENVEPGNYYKILFSGNISSQDNLLLSYYYNGDHIPDEIYYIKNKHQTAQCVEINEVLSYPSETPDFEFIEIVNCSNDDVDLRGYSIKIDDFKPQKLLFAGGAYRIRPSDYSLLLSNVQPGVAQSIIYVEGKFGKNGLSNTELRKIQLLNESGRVVSEFYPFAKAKKGVSFERINPYDRSIEKNWGYSKAMTGSTPHAKNSIFLTDIFPPEMVDFNITEEDRETNIVLKFNEDIVCDNSNCIYLLSDKGEKISGISNVENKNICFISLNTIEYESKYKVIATSALGDKNQNRYIGGEVIGEIITPVAPSLRLYYPKTNIISYSTKYLEFISNRYALNKSEVYLKGKKQRLSMSCVEASKSDHYLCTIIENAEGTDDLCMFVNGEDTNLCINFSSEDMSTPPTLNIGISGQIKDRMYIQAESNIPCLLFIDFLYKEDLDESFSYSTYSFSQRFDYNIQIQDPYKEYFVDIYCIDSFNQITTRTRLSTTAYSENEDSIIINEILPNPKGADTNSEFIEIFNNGKSIIDLSKISIGDCVDIPLNISKFSQNNLLPNASALIVSNGSNYFSKSEDCGIISASDRIIGRDLKNSSPERICLYYKDILVDIYNSELVPTSEGISIERIDKNQYFETINWKFSDIPGGTPCK